MPTAKASNPWVFMLIITAGISYRNYSLALPEAAGAGTNAAINACHNQRGQIPSWYVLKFLLATVATLGTGGSGSKEGPISMIGSDYDQCRQPLSPLWS